MRRSRSFSFSNLSLASFESFANDTISSHSTSNHSFALTTKYNTYHEIDTAGPLKERVVRRRKKKTTREAPRRTKSDGHNGDNNNNNSSSSRSGRSGLRRMASGSLHRLLRIDPEEGDTSESHSHHSNHSQHSCHSRRSQRSSRSPHNSNHSRRGVSSRSPHNSNHSRRGVRRVGSGSLHRLWRPEPEEADRGSEPVEPAQSKPQEQPPRPKKLQVITHREKDHVEYLQLIFESGGGCHCETKSSSSSNQQHLSKVSRHRRRVHSRYAQLAL